MFIFHGYTKLLSGPQGWEGLGGSMKNVGINFFPMVWGFMAAITETFGGFLLILGLAFRPVCLLLFITMVIVAIMHFKNGDGLSTASHAIEVGIIFLGLTFIGPGKYSVDRK